MVISVAAYAQRPDERPRIESPVVHPDNTVTFNYYAPDAKDVKVSVQFAGENGMTKDKNGVWSVTLGPAAPDYYPYCFIVDGINVMDPLNPDYFPNENFKNSLADINAPSLYKLQNVPHGSMDYIDYSSVSVVPLMR